MRQVPNKIKQIREIAMTEVFAQDINKLDPEAREVLEKVINYMEKKYIKVPMVMAKDILVKNTEFDNN
jgi:glutamyl-tRNA reductase